MIGTGPEDDFLVSHEPSEWRVYSVCEITREIKRNIEEGFAPLAVEGEISNFKRHTSGHLYFSLKDAEAQIACVLWRGRSQNLPFQPHDGAKVLAFGNLSVYERQGKYQLDVMWLRPIGAGEWQLAFEALKKKLADEGLFDADRKKPIPPFPSRIGVVTSETGAALRDIASIIARRAPWVQLILRPARVQGEGAAEDIAAAIDEFNAYGEADVLIVGRGGGSIEDLWAFNQETVARAIARSNIPVVSAVGHEVDFSISDFTADLRAPTPSAAAELVVPDRAELIERIQLTARRIVRHLKARIVLHSERVSGFQKSYGLRRPGERLREYRQRLDDLTRGLETGAALSIRELRLKSESVREKLAALNPEAVLLRGYSITTRARDGRIVTRSEELHSADAVRIRFASGSVRGIVESIES
jgi:exodeoxyribonuclease VII large subunit